MKKTFTPSECWQNVYKYNNVYFTGNESYISVELATKDLCDKKHYLHTINLKTGEIITANLKEEKE